MLVSLVPAYRRVRVLNRLSHGRPDIPVPMACLLLDVLDRLRAFGGEDARDATALRAYLSKLLVRDAPVWAGAARGGDAPLPLDSPDMSEPAAPDRTGSSPSPLSDPNRSGPLDPAVAVGLLQRAQSLARAGRLAARRQHVLARGRQQRSRPARRGAPGTRRVALPDGRRGRRRSSAGSAPRRHPRVRSRGVPGSSWPRRGCVAGDLTGAARAYREAERRAPASERAEIASRLGWLAKETGDTRARGPPLLAIAAGRLPSSPR